MGRNMFGPVRGALFDGGLGGLDGYEVVEHALSDAVTHVRIERRAR